MRACYRFDAEARCPDDPTIVDRYTVTVHVGRLILVENLLAIIAEITAEPIYQETLTEDLAFRLRPARVVTHGIHSGVTTRAEAESRRELA